VNLFCYYPILTHRIRRTLQTHMKHYEVDYETTLPPWRYGHEFIDAEDLNIAKALFRSRHDAARIYKIQEKSVVSEKAR